MLLRFSFKTGYHGINHFSYFVRDVGLGLKLLYTCCKRPCNMEMHQKKESLKVIAFELQDLQTKCRRINYRQMAKNAFGMKSMLPWSFLLLAILFVIIFFVGGMYRSDKTDYAAGCIVLLLLIVNSATAVYDSFLKYREVFLRIKLILDCIKGSTDNPEEYTNFMENLENMCSPSGPSRTFTSVWKHCKGQTTEKPVSFPTSLIATGDFISLCVGETSPCQAVCTEDPSLTLQKDGIFAEDIVQGHITEHKSDCRYRFRVLKSPITEELEMALFDKRHKNRNCTFKRNKTRSMLVKRRERMMHFFLVYMIPLLFIISSLFGIFWYIFQVNRSIIITDYNKNETCAPLFSDWSVDTYWFQIFVYTPTLTLLPLVPIICPTLWLLLYGIGEAKTLSPCISSGHGSGKRETLPRSATTHSMSVAQLNNDSQNLSKSSWMHILPYTLFGNEKVLPRNAGTFDILGSLTVLCCINKEGLLSWIDPYPEKVFFMKTNNVEDSCKSSDDSRELPEKNATLEDQQLIQKNESTVSGEAHTELLTLSQDTQDSAKLHFDETDWSKHLSSLKAICLNIIVTHPSLGIDKILFPIAMCDQEEEILATVSKLLLDLKDPKKDGVDPVTCQQTLEMHQKHIADIATGKRVYGPGTSTTKNGLLSLAELTGFKQDVSFLYLPKRVITLYKSPTSKQRTSTARTPNLQLDSDSHLPYVHGVVVSQLSKEHHLLVAGSADMVTHLCGYYFDGGNILPFDEAIRAKATDFYNRSAAVGHCVAFSCIPVSNKFAEQNSVLKEVEVDNISASDLPSNQVFLGMVSLQYQSRLPVFHMVEALESACIRFVHFTQEDEVRSRVFAEKMGVEVGWNCHISLSACNTSHASRHTSTSHAHTATDSDEEDAEDTELLQQIFSSSPTSESTISESAFHALNRAKLPRGIENIIPHIENVDNVPLLVPLFTDCQKDSMCKMIEIMQKYGEVVCCIGSADSLNNFPVFAHANVGIALEPVVASDTTDENRKINRNVSFNSRFQFESSPFNNSSTLDSIGTHNAGNSKNSLMEVARRLNTFPCSVTLSGEDSLAVVYSMIKQARHFLFLVQVCLIFYIKCLSVTSLTQLVCHVTHFPLMFAPGDLLWLCYVVFPLLSYSILGSPSDPDLMSWASLKNTRRQVFHAPLIRQNVAHFCIKFLPSCLVVFLLYALAMQSSCLHLQEMVTGSLNTSGTTPFTSASGIGINCYPFFDLSLTVTSQTTETIQAIMAAKRREVQQIAMFGFVLYMCVISAGYVHRWRLMRKASPFTNRLWLFLAILTVTIQAIYSAIVIFSKSATPTTSFRILSLGPYQIAVWVMLFAWPVPCLACNEMVKWREIRLWDRSQKRARLDFGTKLGMNSPF